MKTYKILFEEIKNKQQKEAPGQQPEGTSVQQGQGGSMPSVLPSELKLNAKAQNQLSKHAVDSSAIELEAKKISLARAQQGMQRADIIQQQIAQQQDVDQQFKSALRMSRLNHSLRRIQNSGDHRLSDDAQQAQSVIGLQMQHHQSKMQPINNTNNKGVK